MRRRTIAILAAAAPTLFGSMAHAADTYSWAPLTGGTFSWSDIANWTGGTSLGFPQVVSDLAFIQPGPASAVSIALPTSVTIARLSFGNTASAQTIDIGNANSDLGALAFQNSAGGGTGTITSGGVPGAVNTITAPIQPTGTTGSTIQIDVASTNSLKLGTIQCNGANGTFINNMTAAGAQLIFDQNLILNDVTTPATTRGIFLTTQNNTTTVVNGVFQRLSGSGTVALNIAGVDQPFGKFILNSPQTISALEVGKATVILGNDSAMGVGTINTRNGNNANWGAQIQSNDDARKIQNNILLGNACLFGGSNSLTVAGWISEGNARTFGNTIAAGKSLTLSGDGTANANGVAIACSNLAGDGNRVFTIDGPGYTIVSGKVVNNNVDDTPGTNVVGGLTKRGTGVLDLNNPSNTYRGATVVGGGLLRVGALGAIQSSTGVTVSPGAGIWYTPGTAVAADFNAFLAKIVATSGGALSIPASEAATNFDFTAGSLATNAASMSLGADGNVTYTGIITPTVARGYRLGGPTGALTLNGVNRLTGVSSVSYVNGGTVIVNGVQDYAGTTTLGGAIITTNQAGMVTKNAASLGSATLLVSTVLQLDQLANAGAGGTPTTLGASSNAASNLIFSGGTLRYVGTGSSIDRLFTNSGTLGGFIDASGSGALVFSNTAAHLSTGTGPRTLTLTGTSTDANQIAGSLTDGAAATLSLAKAGTGKWVLSNSNTFIGTTSVTAGTLQLTHAEALRNSPLLLNAGNLSPVFSTGIGSFALGGLSGTINFSMTDQGGSPISLNLGNSAVSGSTYAGNLSGGNQLIKSGSVTQTLTGTNTYSGATSLRGGNLAITADAAINGAASSISFEGGNLQINGTAIVNINSHAVNWTTFNGGFNINDATNTFTVDANLAGAGSLTKSGAGTLLLTGNNGHTGGTRVNAGNLVVATSANLGGETGTLTLGGGTLLTTAGLTSSRPISLATAGGTFDTNGFNSSFASLVTGTGTLTKANGGVLSVNAVRSSAVNLNGGTLAVIAGRNPTGKVSNVATLAFNGASFDLNDNDLVINYTNAGVPDDNVRNTIRDRIRDAYNNNAWNGNGLTSTQAQLVATSAHPTALGFAEASKVGISTFDGITTDNDMLLVRYTYSGDANLDGKVNALDFNAVASNFGTSGKFWYEGDYNYNGDVNIDDFTLLSMNFNQSVAIAGDLPGASLGTLVPEPASLGLLGSLVAMATRRRRGTR